MSEKKERFCPGCGVPLEGDGPDYEVCNACFMEYYIGEEEDVEETDDD